MGQVSITTTTTDKGTKKTIYRDDASGASAVITEPKKGLLSNGNSIDLYDRDEHIALSRYEGAAAKLGTSELNVNHTSASLMMIPIIIGNSVIMNPQATPESWDATCKRQNKEHSVSVIQDVGDSILRDRAQDFALQHPQLAEELKKDRTPVAHYDGHEATFAELLKAPSHFEGCPASGEVVKKKAR